MAFIRIKEGVRFDTIAPGGFRILSALQEASDVLGQDLTITAGTDGIHSGPNDPHYRGCAYDVRTLDMPQADAEKLQAYLEDKLGPDFTIILETSGPHTTAPHMHIQVKKGIVYG